MGSSSIGGQAVSFGLSVGTTWTDENCQRLKDSRQLVALGGRPLILGRMENADKPSPWARFPSACRSVRAVAFARENGNASEQARQKCDADEEHGQKSGVKEIV